jgi:hypothetical protein
MSIKAGDWVRSYHAGIWRVLQEIPDHYEPRISLRDAKELYEGPLFVVKRLVNDKWKTAFEIETAHGSLVRPLNKADTKKLDAYQLNNPDAMSGFDAFERPLMELLNIGFALGRKSEIPKLQKEVAAAIGDISIGVTSDAILQAIASSSFADCCGESPQSATLQFVNKNYEIRRRELIYREMNVLKF